MVRIERVAIHVELSNGLELSVPAQRLSAPRGLKIDMDDLGPPMDAANVILARIKEASQ